MTHHNFNISEAIQLAINSEKLASEFYTDAAQKTEQPQKKIFEQLADIELAHYKKLVALKKSLSDKGEFSKHDEEKLPIVEVPRKEKFIKNEKISLIGIISLALDNEKKAQETYLNLSEQTLDSDSKKMFKKLAADENQHYEILHDVYWKVNQTGEWK